MAEDLSGRKIAIIPTNGVEQVELEKPREAGRGGRSNDGTAVSDST
jgi:hypothetical protein